MIGFPNFLTIDTAALSQIAERVARAAQALERKLAASFEERGFRRRWWRARTRSRCWIAETDGELLKRWCRRNRLKRRLKGRGRL